MVVDLLARLVVRKRCAFSTAFVSTFRYSFYASNRWPSINFQSRAEERIMKKM